MVTIKDIAKRLNTSVSTVSRALTNKNGVNDKLRATIKSIAEEMGYHPNFKARALVGGNVGVIGVIVPHSSEAVFSNPFYPEVLKGIGSVADRLNYYMLLSFETTDNYSSMFFKRLVDGIIILAHRIDDDDDEKILELEKKKIPTVLIPGYPHGSKIDLPSVNSENTESVYIATNHLIKLGHRKISFILGVRNSRFTLERFEGYKKAFEQNNIPILKEYIRESDFSKKNGMKCMEALLSLPQPPTAVIGINDNVTLGAMTAIMSRNMTIPKDISVITIGDSEYVSDFTPPLTGIKLNMIEMGRRAAQTLVNQLNGIKLRKKNITIPSKFIVRGSTDVPKTMI